METDPGGNALDLCPMCDGSGKHNLLPPEGYFIVTVEVTGDNEGNLSLFVNQKNARSDKSTLFWDALRKVNEYVKLGYVLFAVPKRDCYILKWNCG